MNNSCSAQQAATVAALIQDTAPTCTFEITCTGASLGCIYTMTLDANGTLLVEGHMSVEVVAGAGTATFYNIEQDAPAPDPSCSGAFQCHYASSLDNPVLPFVNGVSGVGALLKVTCSGGALAVQESVNCGAVNIELEPSPA